MSRSPSASTHSPSRSSGPDESSAYKRKRSASPQPADRSASPAARRARHGPNSPTPPPARATIQTKPLRGHGTDNAAPTGDVGGADAAAKAEFAKLLGSRSGGAYIPPARLRLLQAEASKNKASAEYQRLSWDALRKSINGLINKVNTSNIKHVIPELFGENLIRGKGLFARSVMRAQASSLPFTPIFAALVAIVNTKLPQVGELVLVRLISQFRRAYKRNDKVVCNATSTFIAHLVNQYVAHELVALQILLLCLERPTDDSIEVAVGFMREVGFFLAEHSPKANNTIFERFRAVLHEGAISKRCQYMIEVLFQVRKDKYKDNPTIPPGLDLVEEEEQITHRITLDDELQVLESLNLFKADPNFLENEERYVVIKQEILEGSDGSESGESGSEEDSEDEEDAAAPEKEGITDMTETNLINLRRTIYLTIMNSLNFEEAVHKLMKINLPEGREIEMCNMIIECCSQERTYSNFYGLIGERLCKLNRIWTECFQEAFAKYYETIHRYETNKLRNIGRFFGHLIASDGISWAVLHVVHMNEDETTSSSRIFVKIMMTEMIEEMGNTKVVERFRIPDLRPAFAGLFPMDNPKNTRFAINYFTSIGMGKVTEDMRAFLADAPRLLAAQHAADRGRVKDEDSSSDEDSDESSVISSSSDDSSDESDSEDSRRGGRGRGGSRRTPPPIKKEESRRRDQSDSRSPPRYLSRNGQNQASRRASPPRRKYSPSRSRSRSRTITPPPPPRTSSKRRSPSPVRGSRRERYDDTPPRSSGRRYESPPRRGESPPRRR